MPYWLSINKNNKHPSQTAKSFHEISNNQQHLVEWIHKEQAILQPDQDSFDMAHQAKNIGRALLERPLKSVALVGEYGSGKSSIINMVGFYLNPQNRRCLNQNNRNSRNDLLHPIDVIHCTISGWGLAKGSAAEHILEGAINELSKYLDVSGLRTVPEQYAVALGMIDNFFIKIVSNLITCWKSPLDVLRKIDNVLTIVDKRLIIFLEDVDRNKSDEVFLNEIAVLLRNIRELNNVSFVLAIGQKYDVQDVLIKIAERVENVPRPNRFDVLDALKNFKLFCDGLCPNIISTIPKNYDKDRIGWDRSERLHVAAQVDNGFTKPIDEILKLIDNPRLLKHILRETLTIWKKLAGEIDFDDLLIVCILKVLDEKVFSFIDRHINRLCALVVEEKTEFRDEIRKLLENDFKLATANNEYNIDAIAKLINTLFPGFTDLGLGDWNLRQDLIHYQHVANNEPTIYWERIKRGELDDYEIADCETLEAIKKWNDDHENKAFKDMEMAEVLSTDQKFYRKVVQFKHLISQACLQKVASKQFRKTLKKYGNKASPETCPALTKLFVLKPEQNNELWRSWLLDETKKAIRISLRYANELYYFWNNPKRNLDNGLRAKIVNCAKDIIEKDQSLLANVLEMNFVWSIADFTNYFGEKVKLDTFELQQWNWLGQALIKAAPHNPQVVSVQIAGLISYYSQYDFSNRTKNSEKLLYQEDIKLIFKDRERDVMKLLLLENVDVEKYEDTVKKAFLSLRDEATRWLKQNKNF